MARSSRPRSHDRWDPRLTAHALLRSSPRDRGTILLMVVGVLALLAIIGVVYATLGKSDRSAGATNQRKARAAEQVEDVGGYLSGIIGDATFAVYPERTGKPVGSDGAWLARVRGYDPAFTDQHFLSVPANPTIFNRAGVTTDPRKPNRAYAVFSPTGSWDMSVEWDVTKEDFREYGNPFLASIEPEYLRTPLPTPAWERLLGGNFASIANRHDWRAISNFSPRGNFVNLANLRVSRGGFNARPGFAANNMSFGLTLYDPQSGLPYHFDPASPATSSKWPEINPNGVVGTVNMINANPLVPAHWTMNQVWAFRPAIADDRDSTNNLLTPSSFEYSPNQWADTDGDGFFDARWFEIYDIGELFGNTAAARAMFSPRGRSRIFVAARCVDSSAMLNVNVGNDTFKGPEVFSNINPSLTPRDFTMPPSMSAGDVSLLRLLRQADISEELVAGGIPAARVPYADLPNPSSTTSPELAAAQYSIPNATPYNTAAAGSVGIGAYNALITARGTGSTEQAGHYPGTTPFRLSAFDRLGSYSTFLSPGHSLLETINTHRIQTPFDLADELELRTFAGVNNSDSLSRLEAAAGGRVQTPAKYRDYSPLRDNRPRSLEMLGRDEFGPTAIFTDYSPTANPNPQRSALLSVFADIRHLLTTVNGARPMKDGSVGGDTTASGIPFADGASTDVSAALAAINNYSRFDRDPMKTDPPRYNAAGALFTTWDKPARDDYINYQRAVQLIFRLYLNALAPYTTQSNTNPDENLFPDAWQTTNVGENAFPGNQFELYRTGLVYGGNAELAYRMAAHMTANLIDSFDRDRKLNMDPALPHLGRATVDAAGSENAGRDRTEPTPLSLQLTANPVFVSTGLANISTAYKDSPVCAQFATGTTSRLAPEVTNLSSGHAYAGGTPSPSGMMNVFGVEPQPFITEISWYGIYSGDPAQGGGIGGNNGSGLHTQPGPGNSSPFDPRQVGQPSVQTIKIQTQPDLTGNADFIGEVIAVQLNNPFNQDVVLYDPRMGMPDAEGAGSSTTDTRRIDRFRYYLEFAGRYYAFARQKLDQMDFATDLEAENDPVVLHAGETRVFFFTNPGSLQAIATRANARVGGSAGYDATKIEEWLTGKWTNGKPELSSNQAMGTGQLFIRNAHNVSPSSFNQAIEGDPTRPQPIIQVYPTTFNKVGAWPAHGTDYMDLWGFDARGSGDEQLKQVTFSDPGLREHAPARRVVNLWRMRRSESSTQVAPLRTGGDLLGNSNPNQDYNDLSNDILADRLRDPAGDMNDANGAPSRGSVYEPRIALENAGNITITHTGSPIPYSLSFIAHGHIRRPTDTDVDPQVAPTGTYPVARGTTRVDRSTARRVGTLRGALPPWCLEVRPDDDFDWLPLTRIAAKFSLNLGESFPTTGTIANYSGEGPYVAPIATVDTTNTSLSPQPMREQFSSLLDLLSYRAPVNTEIGKPCEQKIGNDIHVNRDLRDYKDVAVEYFDVGEDRLGGAAGELDQVTTHLENTTINRTLPIRRSRNPNLYSRAGDFLLPLAVGPWFDPSRSGMTQSADIQNWTGTVDVAMMDREVQWNTLSEALALSCGYYGPHNPKDPYWRFGQLKPVDGRFPKTDRGHLALDRFSPYMQAPGMTRQPLGSGVPFALSIIDQFRSVPGIASTPIAASVNAPPVPELQARLFSTPNPPAFGGGLAAQTGGVSTRPDPVSSVTLIPARPNANTMPESVAGTVSMLWPRQTEDNWMYTGAAAPYIIAPGMNEYPDLVKTLIDYRNNMLRTPPPAGNPGGARNYVKRSDPLATNVDSIRTSSGIKSLGELGAINFHRVNNTYPNSSNLIMNYYEEVPGYSMFHFGLPETTAVTGPNPNDSTTTITAPRLSFNPGVSTGGFYDRRADGRIQDGIAAPWQPGVSNQVARKTYDASGTAIASPPTTTAAVTPLQSIGSSQLDRSYQDKLAILNAVTGSVSVRSDIFTVYFVVHAYTPESVDIPDDQPLVPSMAKRFVMVVDRSTVKNPGDKPRILMLKEVPMN